MEALNSGNILLFVFELALLVFIIQVFAYAAFCFFVELPYMDEEERLRKFLESEKRKERDNLYD